jgi:hypothetical protein
MKGVFPEERVGGAGEAGKRRQKGKVVRGF